MDKVFSSAPKKNPKKINIKQFLGKNLKYEVKPGYFSYESGKVDAHEFHPQFLGNEPTIPLTTNSNKAPIEGSNEKDFSRVQLNKFSYSAPACKPSRKSDNFLHKKKPLPSVSKPFHPENFEISALWTFYWLNDLPTSIDACIPLIRQFTRYTVILKPIDDLFCRLESIVPEIIRIGAAIELLIIMLVGYQLAKVVQLICSPAVFIVNILFRIFQLVYYGLY